MKQFVIKKLILPAACLLLIALAAESSSSSSKSSSSASSTATQSRSGSAAANLLSAVGAIGGLIPNLITNVAPLMLLVGLGALMMPALGMNALGSLLRESRRSANDAPLAGNQMNPNFNLPAAFAQYAKPLQSSPQDFYYFTKRSLPGLWSSAVSSEALASGFQDLLGRVLVAVENSGKQYNQRQ